jgi:hypothetical protein
MCNDLQMIWRSKCECAVCWSLISNAENPRTWFDLQVKCVNVFDSVHVGSHAWLLS